MITEKPAFFPLPFRKESSQAVDWLTVSFGILAVLASVAIGWATHEYGYVALLVIPALVILLLSVTHPGVGLSLLVFVTFTQLSNVLIKFHGLPSIAQPVTALLVVVIAIRVFVFGDRKDGWVNAAIRLGIYGIAGFLSIFVARNFEAARLEFSDYIKDALSAMIVVFLLSNPGRFKQAVWAIILAGAVMGSISVFQYLTNTFDNTYFGFGNWITEVAGQVERSRIAGPFSNPNAYAQTLVVVVPLALDQLWHERRSLLRLLAAWALAVSVLTIFFTYSRGGLLALVFALAVLLIDRRPNFLPVLGTAAIAVALLGFVPSTYTQRISTLLEFLPGTSNQLYDTSFRGRVSENEVGLMIFRDHPLLGVGMGNYPMYYQNYSTQLGLDYRRVARSPHSLYIEVLSEQGIVGILAFTLLLFSVHRGLRQAKENFLRSGAPDYAWMTGALWAGLLGYLFAGIFKNSAYSNSFWILIGMAMAVAQLAHQTYLSFHEAQAKRSLTKA